MAVCRRDSVSRSPRRRRSHPLRVESLEDRLLLATFLVNLAGDENDADPNDMACDIEPAIPGDQCTLRAAIQQSNFSVGVADEITFNIGGGGPQTIAPQLGLPAILDPVTINGATQPGFLPAGPLLIELNGQAAGAVPGLRISTMNATVSSLVINRFGGSGITIQGGGNNALTANFIGTDAFGMAALPNTGDGISIFDSVGNRIGGPNPGDGNLISGNTSNGVGVFGLGTSQTLVQGNLIGLNAARIGPIANGLNGIHLNGSPNNLIGGQANTERNVISGNRENGIRVSGITATGNNIFGNFIGTIGDGTVTDPDGIPGTGDELGNRMHGVQFDDAPGNFLGRTGAQEFNIIAGSLLAGVRLTGNLATNNVLRNNFIGTNESGQLNLGNSGPGIIIQDSFVSTIGGPGAGERNVIAFNNGDGIAILNGVSNRISRNSIHDNAALGINLFPAGPNFPQDPDPGVGPNGLQNFPDLAAVGLTNNTTRISGTLTSAATTMFTLEFFSNAAADATGFGEGDVFLGTVDVTTDPMGVAIIDVTNPILVPFGSFISATATDPNGNTSEFSNAAMVTPPDLSIAKTDSADPVIAGTSFNYLLTVTNNGPSDATGVTITDTLPADLTFDPATSTAGCSAVGQNVTCTIGTMLSGAVATRIVAVTAASKFLDGTGVSNTANVAGNEADPIITNNSSNEVTTVNRQVDLRVQVADNPDPVIAGSGAGNLVHTMTVTNDGPSDASGVMVDLSNVLPAGANFVSAVGDGTNNFDGMGTDLWTIGSLTRGAVAILTVTYSVGASTAHNAVLSVTADNAKANEMLINPGNDADTETTTVNRQADLTVAMIDSVDPVLAGNSLAYTITVTNVGPSDASGVTLTDTLPAGVLLLSAIPAQGLCIQPAQNLVACNLGDLPNTGTTLVTVSVAVLGNVPHGTVITNTVVVAGNEADPVANNQVMENTTVNRESDVAVTVTDSPDPIGPGGTLIYDLTVTTSPPSTADSVTVTDTLPAGVTFISASAGCVHAAGVVTCALGNLASGLSIPLQIRVRINAGTQGVITNTATVTSTTFDPLLTNNTSMVDTTVVPLDIRVTEFTQEGGTPSRLAITYEILGTAPIFDFRFFASADPRFDAADPELFPAVAVTNAADLSPGLHTIAFDAAVYGPALLAIDVTFFVTRAFIRPVAGVVAPEVDLTNNDLNFIGVFHVPGSPLVIRGRVDNDRRNGFDLPPDNPDDAITIFGGATTTVTGNIPGGLVVVPALGVSEVRILSESGNDSIVAFADLLRPVIAFGGTGDDVLIGGSGNDTFFGEAGDDVVVGDAGNDLLDGGDGIDEADFGFVVAGVNVNLSKGTARGQGRDLLVSIENVSGSALRDRITGNAGPNILFGGPGADLIVGGDGVDAIDGGPGDDTLIGGEGDDGLDGGDGDDCICGGAGADRMDGGTGDDRMEGGDGDDVISAGDGNDRICGGDGTDMLMGEAGKDLIEGGAGVDMLLGGVGFDLFLFDLFDLPIDFGGVGADGGKAARE